jgi:hypothetical protein
MKESATLLGLFFGLAGLKVPISGYINKLYGYTEPNNGQRNVVD